MELQAVHTRAGAAPLPDLRKGFAFPQCYYYTSEPRLRLG
jgi:hypothetical protein